MDKFDETLKEDATEIVTGDSAQLRERIDASLRATKRIKPVPEGRPFGVNFWLASSLTGLAAAVIAIVLINWNRQLPVETPVEPAASVTVPEFEQLEQLNPPRLIRTAEFTTPLEEELAHLQADIERARAVVKKDIDFTF